MQRKITASIIGITGFTGLELLRLLLAHPYIELKYLTSRQHDDERIGAVYPHLAHLDHKITNTDPLTVAKESDVVFLALPHKTAQDVVAQIYKHTRVVDLSADYRLDDLATYEQYYTAHTHPDLFDIAVYGLPEITDHDAIKNAPILAIPGCFAHLAQMLLWPFAGQIQSADIMAITGSSGAGKSPSEGTHHPTRNHNIKSYNINAHRHIPEICRSAEITPEQLNFVPTSGPFTRGIFAQAFITLKNTPPDLNHDALHARFQHSPFIRISDSVALANVTGSNFCDLSFALGQDGRIIAQGALDNLIKGASGTAIQSMNIAFEQPQHTGLLNLTPLYP